MAFNFKKFSVDDNKSTMKVGTDAVLLGAWVDINGAESILDVGTGCGVIALMLAQRSQAIIDAVEIDRNSAEQARENFEASPWKINIHNTAIQDYDHAPYDLIVSNPPFFSKSLLPPTAGRKLARHTTTLTHEDLLSAVDRLLSPAGRFAVIVPGEEIIAIAGRYGLECGRITSVYPRNKLERLLIEFSRDKKVPVKSDLVLYDGEKRSEAYSKLAQEYYLATF